MSVETSPLTPTLTLDLTLPLTLTLTLTRHALVFLLLGVGLALPPLLAAGSAWGRRRRRRISCAGGAGGAGGAIALTRIDEAEAAAWTNDAAEAAGLAPQSVRVAGEGGARHAERTLPPRAANL